MLSQLLLTAIMSIYNFGKGNGKVVPVLLLSEHNAIKAYWGVEV
jgi:hypothetical protein